MAAAKAITVATNCRTRTFIMVLPPVCLPEVVRTHYRRVNGPLIFGKISCTGGAARWRGKVSHKDGPCDRTRRYSSVAAARESGRSVASGTVTVSGGSAEFERHLILARTGEGRRQAPERGVRLRGYGPADAVSL